MVAKNKNDIYVGLKYYYALLDHVNINNTWYKFLSDEVIKCADAYLIN